MEKEDLEAQGLSSSGLCPKCFAQIGQINDFCPECGAPLGDDPAHLEGSDSVIYPELARANLLRMRGDYDRAEEVCRAILRRFPNSATATALIGDICAEKGALHDAARWYELALDIIPGSEAETKKLARVRQQISEREAIDSADQLGIPSKKPRVGLYAGIMLAVLIVACTTAFLIGRQSDRGSRMGKSVQVPFEAGTPQIQQPPVQSPNNAPEEPREDAGTPVGQSSLLLALSTKSVEGSKLVDAWLDQRSKILYLSFSISAGDNPRVVAANLARAAFDHVTDAQVVVLRGLAGAEDSYQADAMRSAWESIDAAELARQLEADPEALAKLILTKEWSANASGSTPPPQTGQPATSDQAGGQ